MTADDFARTYEAESPALLAMLVRLLRDPEEARDALHDAFLQAWRDRDRFDERRGRRGAWLHVLARTRGLDRVRRLRRIEMLPFDAPPTAFAAEPEIDRSRVRRALERLPAPQVAVLRLHLDGHSQSEIAAALAIPVGTVKWRMRTAKQSLTRAFAD